MRIRVSLGAFLVAASFVVLTGTAPAVAAVVFNDNFEAGVVGSAPGTPWSSIGASSPATTVLVKQDATGSLFGIAGNKYGEFIDTTLGGTSARADGSFSGVTNSFLTVSFDFYEISGVGIDPTPIPPELPQSFNVQVGSNPSSTGGRGIDFRLSNGELYHTLSDSSVNSSKATVADYQLNVKNHIDIVANFNASAAGGDYGFDSLANGTYDIWLNGELAANNLPFRNFGERLASIDGIRLGTDNSTVQTFYVDNVQIFNEAIVVPEPNAAVILSVGGLFLVRRRKS